MKNRLLLSCLVALLLGSGQISFASSTFPDISDSFAQVEILELTGAGIIHGYPDGTFRPEKNINRAEFVTLLMLAKEATLLQDNHCFADINPEAWHAKYVCAAKSLYYLSGYPDGSFGANRLINRAEAITVVVRTFGLTATGKNYFHDVELSRWYTSAANVAYEKNLLPFENDLFAPGRALTRAEAAYLISAALKPQVAPTNTGLNSGTTIPRSTCDITNGTGVWQKTSSNQSICVAQSCSPGYSVFSGWCYPAGSLKQAPDFSSLGIIDLGNQEQYVLGGATAVVGSFDLVPRFEGVFLKSVRLTNVGSSNLYPAIKELRIYGEGPDYPLLAIAEPRGESVTIKNLHYLLRDSGVTKVYLEALANEMGKNQIGEIQTDLQIKLEVTETEGVTSGKNLLVDFAQSTTPSFATVPTKITAAEFVDSALQRRVATSLSGGTTTIGILTVSATSGANTDQQDGTPLITIIQQLEFEVGTSLSLGANSVVLERLDKTSVGELTTTHLAGPGTFTVSVNPGQRGLDLDSGETAYFAIVINSSAAHASDFVEVRLKNLGAAGINYGSSDLNGLEFGVSPRTGLRLLYNNLDGPKLTQ